MPVFRMPWKSCVSLPCKIKTYFYMLAMKCWTRTSWIKKELFKMIKLFILIFFKQRKSQVLSTNICLKQKVQLVQLKSLSWKICLYRYDIIEMSEWFTRYAFFKKGNIYKDKEVTGISNSIWSTDIILLRISINYLWYTNKFSQYLQSERINIWHKMSW